MLNFRIKDTCISISFFFPALICFFALTDHVGVLQTVLTAVVLHELSHILMLYTLGYRVERMRFSATGIAIEHTYNFVKYSHELMIHLAGPLINLLLALLLWGVDRPLAAAVNLVMGCFNLLPIGNLDGGNVCKILLLRHGRCSPQALHRGNIILPAVLFALGVVVFAQNPENFSLLLVAITMLRTVEM